MIQSDRGQHVTSLVIEWLAGDAPVREEAARLATRAGTTTTSDLGSWLWRRIRNSRRGTNAWYLAQELAENDYFRIAWGGIASSIRKS
ncbi:hypothetical protein L3Q65_01135 (plasmid) [Amycolatopsis sp. FU40]|uniref:hypothetical protein n=1 Tax=Amycolatopsis sp. FU40 TaxID=2914159 RepID=UPI001F1C0E6A|nr:hypothetical protein [Amycolatopsis sp. FU40]UKD50929.1 hypothetical protein L3Q65_01135 [Amycolatopsis sp. FU40]